jgi:hypothetical protein
MVSKTHGTTVKINGKLVSRMGHDQIPMDSVPWTDMKRLQDFMQTKVVCTAIHNPPFKDLPPAIQRPSCQSAKNNIMIKVVLS